MGGMEDLAWGMQELVELAWGMQELGMQEVRALLAVQTAALRRADQKPELHAEVQAVEVATRHQPCHLSEVGWAITRRRQRTSTLAWEQASFQCSPCRGQTTAGSLSLWVCC